MQSIKNLVARDFVCVLCELSSNPNSNFRKTIWPANHNMLTILHFMSIALILTEIIDCARHKNGVAPYWSINY